MHHYRRLPAIAVLVAFALLATLYARPWQPANPAGTDLASLEHTIAAGQATPQTWLAYGQTLYDAGQYARAALAYEKVLQSEPYHRPARFQRGLSLAQAGDREGLLAYLTAQAHVEPKLVAELLDRPELAPSLADGRFTALQKEARAQAMD